MIQQNDDLSQQHEVSIHAREEMNQMMQGILSQNALIDEQQHILLSVNKVSSIQRNFASDFPFPVLTICQSFKVYDQSGFRELVEKAHEISSKRDGVFMWGRFSLIVVRLLFLSTLKLFRLTMFICFMSILEIAAEHAIFYLHEEGSITGSQHHVYISILRKYDLPTYVSVAVLSILASYFTNKSAQPDKVEPTIIKSELVVVFINTIEKRISVGEKARKKEQKQFREQILSLQCQLNPSFTVPQSSIGAPASGMKNN